MNCLLAWLGLDIGFDGTMMSTYWMMNSIDGEGGEETSAVALSFGFQTAAAIGVVDNSPLLFPFHRIKKSSSHQSPVFSSCSSLADE
jgi:hypothetical protein